MHNKKYSKSNLQTEDGEQQDRDLCVNHEVGQQVPIVDVWADNFDEQLKILTSISQQYNVVAIDTEFPGNFIKKHTLFQYYKEDQIAYQHIWHNVETTKLIQIGFSLADGQGNMPLRVSTWQFHLKFDLQSQNAVHQSISLLQKAGINFQKLKKEGIDRKRFAQAFMSSGFVLNKNIKWIVFHGCYDFGYLLKQLRNQSLPKNPQEFYKSIKIYFPNIYDLKQILKDQQEFREGGLNAISEKIGCARIGPDHQAGSDSLLTLKCFFKLKNILGDTHCQEKFNVIYGIIGNGHDKKYYNQQYPFSLSHNYLPNNYSYGPLYQYYQVNTGFSSSFYHNYQNPSFFTPGEKQ